MTQEQYTAGRKSGFHMRESRVLRKVRAGGVARVLKLNTNDAKIAEIFAMAQPDAIWLCSEHCSGSFETMEHQIRAAKIHDVDAFVRVSRGSYSDYIRPLEMDAAGLIVPHVMNLDDAANVRDMTKFAPLGRRPVDGGNNDAMYTRVEFEEYLKTANSERCVLYQMEDPEVMDDLEQIAEMDGVDGLFFGPGDMSVALGIPGQLDNPEIARMRETMAKTARKHNKIAATVSNPETVASYAGMGYNFLNIGADVLAVTQYADKMLAAFDDI
ncbi:HpcH/HpaI aldolase family protein [Maritalea sp.]|uniref:HpcH/HpaI aldolase family protein n=1 Tax=Maritalea sp. TaxID=2003361 RepID=UPI003EF7BE3B